MFTNEQRAAIELQIRREQSKRRREMLDATRVQTTHDPNEGRGNWMAAEQKGSYDPARS